MLGISIRALIARMKGFERGSGTCHRVKSYKASTTIELALMMPVLLLVIIGVVHASFYYHDKGVIYGKVYELGAIGKQQVRIEGGLDEALLISHFYEVTNEKLLLFTEVDCQVIEQGEGVRIIVRAQKGFMSCSIWRDYTYLYPESLIRKLAPVQ